jgi:photosystem II stability/assembly factor-like uncharacterized protein
MKKLSLFIIIWLSVVSFSQVIFQGPANGSVASGVTVTTGTFSKGDDHQTRFNPKPPRNLFTNMLLADKRDMVQPTGPEGSNYIVDPTFKHPGGKLTGDFTLTNNFQGLPDQGYYIPPDPYIAVGPEHIMALVNCRFTIMTKTGTPLKTIESSSWYSSVLSGADPFDPKVIYDHFAKRWVMVWLHATSSVSYLLVSVSDDSIPMGTWYNWKLPADVNGSTYSGNWSDYQGVGYDKDAIYVTSNQFSYASQFNYAKIRVIKKSDLYANTAGIVNWKDLWDIRTADGSNTVFGLRPSRIYGQPNEYYLLNRSPYVTGTYFILYKLTNPLTTPSLTAVNVPVTAYTSPPDAAQLGSTYTIDGGGDNLRNEPLYLNGTLFMTHAVKTGSNYSAVHYCAINTSTNTATSDIAMGVDGYYHTYPALSVDNNGNVVITYSRSSASDYMGAFYTTKPSTSSTLTGSKLLKAGNGSYYKTFGGTRNRWGDYMGAWTDPSVNNKIYILSEYVSSTNYWGTWIGELTFQESSTSIVVTAPDGGENWAIGSNKNITWTSTGVTNVKIEYSTNNGSSWMTVIASTPASTNLYVWTVPNTPSNLCLVKISDVNNASITDVSNGTFIIGSGGPTTNWITVTSGTTQDLLAADIVDANVSWICGNNGVVLKSTNGGLSWSATSSPCSSCSLYTIAAVDANIAIVGDGSGNIYRTSNGGSSWSLVSANAGSFMDVVDFVSPSVALAIGDPVGGVWKLLKSTNGGINWSSASTLSATGTEMGFNGSYDRIGNTVWFGSSVSKIYKSSNLLDGPWTSGATTGKVYSFGIGFTDLNTGLAAVNNNAASTGAILKSTNGGLNWAQITFSTTNYANMVDFVDGTPWVWVGTFSDGIFHSSNYGQNWINDVLPVGVSGVNGLEMYPDASNGIAYGPGGLIMKSTFGPVIPVELTSFTAMQNGSIVSLQWQTATERNNRGFEIQRRIIDGENSSAWTTVGFRSGNGTTTNIMNYSYEDNISELTASKIAYRLKQIDFDGRFDISNEVLIENIKPFNFIVGQNYPNPFNPSTTISYSLPVESNVKLYIYNSLGKVVRILTNKLQSAGYYSVNCNLPELTSGLYFYSFEASSIDGKVNHKEVKKMMLLK